MSTKIVCGICGKNPCRCTNEELDALGFPPQVIAKKVENWMGQQRRLSSKKVVVKLEIDASENSGLLSDPTAYFQAAFDMDNENDFVSVEAECVIIEVKRDMVISAELQLLERARVAGGKMRPEFDLS